MANKLVLKKSSVAAKVPLATDLVAGELAVNLADAKLYTKDGSGNVILVGSGAAASGVTSVSGTAPIVSSGGSTPAISISAATTGAAGSMSAADKSKLDGIAAGAQVNTVTSVAGRTGAVTLAVADVSGAQPSATAITTSNIGSQSVNYATSAGSAASAGSATTATYLNSGSSSTSVGNISGGNRVNSGFYENSAPTVAAGWPVTGSWYHLHATTHSNNGNYYSMQMAADFFGNNLYYRSTNGSGNTAWSKVALQDPNGVITLNSNTLTSNYTIPSGSNGVSAGAITIASGVTVTIPSGSTWAVV